MSDEKPNTILIVDDDKTVIEQLTTHFRRRNFEAIATANPTMVAQTLMMFNVQLILLDLRMERLNGYDVLKGLKDKGIEVPVLIITAYFEDEKEKLAQIGITEADVIEKPFRDFAKIEAAINQKLNARVAPDEVGSDYEDEIYYDNRAEVVVVDDEEEITEILADILRERNYTVHIFKDGKQALAFYQENKDRPLIGIIDMSLPSLGGDEIISQAKKLNASNRFIPVSAKYVEEMKRKLSIAGFDPEKLVAKPFDLPTLVEQIKVLATEIGVLGDKF